ncbi:MAG: hypothetical protein QXP53_01985 [Candidatus Pacearchaeota archaeon]
MKKKLNFLFLAFFVLAIITISATASAELTVETKLQTNTVCPSTTILIEEQITSSVSDSFTITLSGSASSFSTAVPPGLYISTGQTKSIFVYITPSTRINPGTYNLEVSISGTSGSKRIFHEIIVENCHKTTLEIRPSQDKICACESKTFELLLNNKGSYLENYKVNVEGPAAQWITLSGSSFALQKNSSIPISAQMKVPCDVKGNYQTTFKVTSDSRFAEAQTTLNIEIVPCYDYIIGMKSYTELCENEKIILPVTIKNLGTADNIYAINLKAPSWVFLDRRNIEVNSGKENILNLVAQPPFKTVGETSVTIEALSEKGKVIRTAESILKVNSCYGVTLDIEKDQDKICNGLNNTYAITIKNTGKFNATFNIDLDAPGWASVEEKTITLEAGKEKVLSLVLNPSKDVKAADYSIIIRIKDPTSGISAEDKLSATTISMEDCYKPLISSDKDEIDISRDSTGLAAITLENKGTLDAEYVIELSGTAASFSQINPATLKIEAGKAQPLYVYLAPSLDVAIGSYTLSVTARLKDTTIISSKTLKINVLKEKEIAETPTRNITNITTNITNVTQITGGVVEEKPKINIFNKIIEFFKNLFKAKAIKEEKITVNVTNQPPKLKKNIPEIKLIVGEDYKINLSEYFEDPEHERLFFTTIKPLKIDVSIYNDIVTLRAKEEIDGERDITFYASDGENIVESNKIRITVTKAESEQQEKVEKEVQKGNETVEVTGAATEKQETKTNFFKTYQNYIIGAIIIVIIIIVLMSGLGKKIVKFFEEEVPEEKKK